MINLLLRRLQLEPTYTHSELFLKDSQGNHHKDFAHIIEDKVRDINADGDLDDEGEGKVYGETAIPYGTYNIQVRKSPKRMKLFEQGKISEERIWLPYIDGVKHFSAVQIHSGVNEKSSLGCLIIGFKWDGKNTVWESRNAETELVKLIMQNDSKYRATIEII